MTDSTSTNKQAATSEEVDRWVESFRTYCEAQHIEIKEDNEEFIALERAFWMGIVTGRGAVALPSFLQMLLFAYRSPILEYKSPLKKRVRRTKAEMEAAAQQEAAVAPTTEEVRTAETPDTIL